MRRVLVWVVALPLGVLVTVLEEVVDICYRLGERLDPNGRPEEAKRGGRK